MPRPLNLLLVEDNPLDAELLLRELQRAGFAAVWHCVDTEEAYQARLHPGLDLVLSDYVMPQFSGLRALEVLKESGLDVPFILVSATVGEEMAVSAIKQGAADYLMKDRLARLGSAVTHALDETRLRRERHQALVALRHSEERLRIVTENARVGLVLINAERRYVFANTTYAEILDLPSPDILGQRVADVLTTLYATQIQPRLDRAFAGERVAYELTRPARSGLHHYAVRYEPIQAGDKVTRVVVVITDITERKQGEASLRMREEQLRLYAEHSPAAVAMLDRDMRYLVVSRRWMEDYRLGTQSLTGRSHYEVFKEIPERWIEVHRRCLAGAVEKCAEEEFLRADGTTDWIRWEVRPWQQADGQIGGIVIFSEDITHRKESDRQIREQLTELLRWQEVMMGREDRVQALKAEVNDLLARLNQPPRYGAEPPAP